jgi:thiamine pyrophosphokinase
VRAHVGSGATVIAVDRGADALRRCGMRPDLIVGDMDSVDPQTLAAFAREGVAIERHPHDKRDTDAALALAHLAKHDRILFLGPGGGRPDHAQANLHLLARAAAHADAMAIDDDGQTWVATPERALRLDLPEGAIVSVLPLDSVCEGITYDGLSYPLLDATMRVGDPFGVSNVARAPPQRISVRKGRLLVMAPSHAKP